MFITRATRHDKADVKEFYAANEWHDADAGEGVTFLAREGQVAGCVRLIEIAPQKIIVEDVVVAAERRGQGLGRSLMQAAMNSRGGALYLCTHPETLGFYEKLGFTEMAFDDLIPEAQGYFTAHGDWPARKGHDHRFMSAR